MSINTQPVHPSQAIQAVLALHKIGIPCMLWGAPGVGKSTIAKAVAEATASRLIDMRLTQVEPVDLRGLQMIDEETKKTKWYIPEFIPDENDGATILFLDELPSADQRLQKSAYQLILDHGIGEHKLPDNCYVMAAGNMGTDGTLIHEMDRATADRFIHLIVTTDPKIWIEWASDNDIDPRVMAFIQSRPDYLECSEMAQQNDWLIAPTPRTWVRVSDIMKGTNNVDLQHFLVGGAIGEAPAADFFAVLDELSEAVNVEKLLKAKNKDERRSMLPNTTEGLHGMAYALTSYSTKAEVAAKAMEILHEMDHNDDLPLREVATLGVELIFKKAMKEGFLSDLVMYPIYEKYTELRREMGLE